MLGQEMDSLADLISFGVAPATLAFTLDFVPRSTSLPCCYSFPPDSPGSPDSTPRSRSSRVTVRARASTLRDCHPQLPRAHDCGVSWVKQGWGRDGQEGGADVPFGVRVLWGRKGGNGEVSGAYGLASH